MVSGKSLFFPIRLCSLVDYLTALSVGFIAGSYPAFALSSILPMVVIKGNFSSNPKGAWLRNGLVIFQFFISIVLIVGTIVVTRQMKFMQDKSLGYDKDHIVVVERAFLLNDKEETFKEELRQLPGVKNVANSFSLLGHPRDFFGSQFTSEGSSEILTTKSMVIGDDFAETIGFDFVEGHGYSKETNDSLSIILNESAVKTMQITDPIGKRLNQITRTPQGDVESLYDHRSNKRL